jgi:hypothetical protein
MLVYIFVYSVISEFGDIMIISVLGTTGPSERFTKAETIFHALSNSSCAKYVP